MKRSQVVLFALTLLAIAAIGVNLAIAAHHRLAMAAYSLAGMLGAALLIREFK